MKKKILNQLIAAALVCGTVLAVGSTSANAAIKTENGKTYSYNELGQKATGWVLDLGNWYYFNENGEMQKNTTIKIGGNDFKFDENGAMISKDGVQKGDSRFIYGNKIQDENGKRYYLNESGKKTGWVDVDAKTYYYNEKGEMQKDTTVKDINGKEVKLSKNGVVVGKNGYELIMGEEVTYDSSEAYKNSQKQGTEQWKKVGNDWYYYFGNDDDMEMSANSWEQNNGVWYYFNDKGIMQKNTTVKDEKGNDCVLNADGALTNRSKPEMVIEDPIPASLKVIDGKTYYMEADGTKYTGWEKIGDKWYYFAKDGVMQKNTTIIDNDIKYNLGADGAWIK